MAVAAPPTSASAAAPARRSVGVATVGTVLEWYDTMLYGYFAVVFARVFLPAGEGLLELVGVYATFAVGYLMRPLGGLFFGWLCDRHGRRLSLTAALFLTALPLAAMTVLPGYATIGVAATVLFVLMRLIQGFALGGEYSGVLTYLSEQGGAGRGRLMARGTAAVGIGVLAAAGIATALSASLSEAALDSWGWRVAYGIGAATGIAGALARRRLAETPAFARLRAETATSPRPVREALRRRPGEILRIALLTGYAGAAYYTAMVFMVGYLVSVAGVAQTDALLIAMVASAAGAALAVPFGALSDRIGRRPQLLGSAIALGAFAYPAFLLIATGEPAAAGLGVLALNLPGQCFFSALAPAMAELLPTRERAAGLGMGYNAGMAALGGTAPAIAALLVHATGVEAAPAWYLIGASVAILPVVWTMRETAFAPLRQR